MCISLPKLGLFQRLSTLITVPARNLLLEQSGQIFQMSSFGCISNNLCQSSKKADVLASYPPVGLMGFFEFL